MSETEGHTPPGAEEWTMPKTSETGSTTESIDNGDKNLKEALESIDSPSFYRQRALDTTKGLTVGQMVDESRELGKDLYYQMVGKKDGMAGNTAHLRNQTINNGESISPTLDLSRHGPKPMNAESMNLGQKWAGNGESVPQYMANQIARKDLKWAEDLLKVDPEDQMVQEHYAQTKAFLENFGSVAVSEGDYRTGIDALAAVSGLEGKYVKDRLYKMWETSNKPYITEALKKNRIEPLEYFKDKITY